MFACYVFVLFVFEAVLNSFVCSLALSYFLFGSIYAGSEDYWKQ